jgi:predicted transcriptional regulator
MSVKEDDDESAADTNAIPISNFMAKTVITAIENNIGSVVIVKRGINGNEPVGIIIRKIGAVDFFTTQTPIRELMSNNLISIKPHSTISDAIGLMHGNNIRRLPVIDNDGKMIWIITDKDILKAALRKRPIASAYILKEFDIED